MEAGRSRLTRGAYLSIPSRGDTANARVRDLRLLVEANAPGAVQARRSPAVAATPFVLQALF